MATRRGSVCIVEVGVGGVADILLHRHVPNRTVASYSFSAEQQVLRRLDKTFGAFFSRIKRGAKLGFPRFRAKTRFESAEFRFGDGLTIRKSKRIVGIPGDIKVRWRRSLPANAKLGAAVISREAGKWYVCFQIELPAVAPIERPFSPVGIDLGLFSLVALSTGDTPQHTKTEALALRRAQRAVAADFIPGTGI
jgi:putative transposase